MEDEKMTVGEADALFEDEKMTVGEADALFRNESGLEFTFVNESYREYTFANGTELYIDDVLFLNVSASGGHRIFTADQKCFYIHPREGWYIKWTPADDDTPHFSK